MWDNYIPNRQNLMIFYICYFYKNVICFSDRVLRMNINTYVLRTVHVLVLFVIRN